MTDQVEKAARQFANYAAVHPELSADEMKQWCRTSCECHAIEGQEEAVAAMALELLPGLRAAHEAETLSPEQWEQVMRLVEAISGKRPE
ncbi:hypothetical protein CCR97_19040 [Rhodoplanes elegans]|uniref:Uncharacterized protein n=1 Tax=Rhodoplanes elegans TaxID=29408 RepID=A0A327KPF5_9BRAD|nr:hypothetical protein [Rhodoplanes elegans]MBK5960281.1 hypothetical protein [Rhodoplanes elegans]RAI40729.1 hypothetical protein CH338_05425 [Rhodoplanes elegans]